MHSYSDNPTVLPYIASWSWDYLTEEQAFLSPLAAEFHTGWTHGSVPTSLRIVFSPTTINENGFAVEADPANQLAIIVTADNLSSPLAISIPMHDRIPRYIQDQLHGLGQLPTNVCFIRLALGKSPMIMAPKEPNMLTAATDMDDLTAFKTLTVMKRFKLWFFDEEPLEGAIGNCGRMLRANIGFSLPFSPTHFRFLALHTHCWPEYHFREEIERAAKRHKTSFSELGLAKSTTHAAPDTESALLIEHLLSRLPNDRERSKTLPWPRGRKTASDFFELADEGQSTDEDLADEEHLADKKYFVEEKPVPEMIHLHPPPSQHDLVCRRAERKRLAEMASVPSARKRWKSSFTELAQPGSETATDDT
ncbi:uncharacterized protein BKCO1_5000128 [Diplodia corticola]|uniref:Uncharacterized protein n=1 Tax=Diplodia corticola TaxID=236234 RepID=A0A1J9SBY0_9PEZI|nr:uncharacterized protein BKCO1_5000128 [Diplodia corticola]OJD37975.1 hypothetical protein BKCO1_5000128 [Diplodia corticola]